MIGDDPCDRGLVDEQGRLVTDNEKQQSHRPDDERSGRPLAVLGGVEVFHEFFLCHCLVEMKYMW